jgi:hypothetical protein
LFGVYQSLHLLYHLATARFRGNQLFLGYTPALYALVPDSFQNSTIAKPNSKAAIDNGKALRRQFSIFRLTSIISIDLNGVCYMCKKII